MIDAGWLGLYQYGVHEEEDGIRTIRMSKDGARVRFAYSYRCVTNHGFDRDHEEGTVIAVSDHEITIEVAASASSSWEDLSKEHHNRESNERYEATFKIARLEAGRPVFRVRGDELTYVEELT